MGPAAQLHGEGATDLHHADPGAVVLAEQGHGAHALGLLEGGLHGVDPVVGVDGGVGDLLDLRQDVRGDRAGPVEVEPHVAGLVERAGLDGLRAEDLPQCGVDEVGGGVPLGGALAPLGVDGGGDELTGLGLAAGEDALVHPELLADLLDVVDPHLEAGGGDHAAVAQLSAGLGVERGAVEQELHRVPLAGDVDGLASGDDAQQPRLVGQVGEAGEDGLAGVEEVTVDGQVGVGVLLGPGVGLGAGALLGHERAEALFVHLQPCLGRHLEGEVDRETVRVVQGERLAAGEHRGARRPGVGGGALEQLRPGLEGLEERDLLGHRDPLDPVVPRDGLGERRTDRVADGGHELGHRLAGRPEQAHGADDATQ